MFVKRGVKLFFVFLVVVVLFLSACRPRQYTSPSEELKVQEVKTDKYVVSALSNVKGSSVVKSLNEEEKKELKSSVVKVAEANKKFSDDVLLLLNLAPKSKNPGVLDAALRLKKIYSVTSLTDDLSLLHEESTTENYDERYDDALISADAGYEQIGELIEEIQTNLEEETEEGTTTNSLLLNHLGSLTDSYEDLGEALEETIEITDDALAPEDTDGDGTFDIVDHDVNNDGNLEITESTEDLNNDGVITLNDVTDNPDTLDVNEGDIDGDGIVNTEDLDVENDGIVDTVVNEIVEETEEAVNLEGVTAPSTDALGDSDDDGVPNVHDTDHNGDGVSDDTNGDGAITGEEAPGGAEGDADGDGLLNGDPLEHDWDGDQVDDSVLAEHAPEEDHDGDGIVDVYDTTYGDLDLDADDDGLITEDDYLEILDTDQDGEVSDTEARDSILYESMDADHDNLDDITGEVLDGTGLGLYDHLEVFGEPVHDIESVIYSPPNLDADDDGVINFADSDIEGDGVSDSTDTDDDNDGTEDALDSDVDNDGLDDRNTDAGSEKEAEQEASEEAEKAAPSDSDDDGTPDYEESGAGDDADGDGKTNEKDEYWLDSTNSKEEFKNSVQYMNYVRFSETGIASGVVFVAPPYEVFRTMEEAENDLDYDKHKESYAVLYKSDFETYLNEHPEIKDYMESEMERHEFFNPNVKEDYQNFAIRNSELGFGKELAYYYQEHTEDIIGHPEAFVIPDVAAHMETMKEIHEAYEKGGLEALKDSEGIAKEIYDYLSENPGKQGDFLSNTESAYVTYEQNRGQYISEHGQESLKEQFVQVYGEDAAESYSGYFGHYGEITTDAQHAYDQGGALGAPISSEFHFAENFAPPPGFTGSADSGGFHAPGGETYHVGDSGSFSGYSAPAGSESLGGSGSFSGSSSSDGGAVGPAPGGDGGGGHMEGGEYTGMAVFTGWYIYSF